MSQVNVKSDAEGRKKRSQTHIIMAYKFDMIQEFIPTWLGPLFLSLEDCFTAYSAPFVSNPKNEPSQHHETQKNVGSHIHRIHII